MVYWKFFTPITLAAVALLTPQPNGTAITLADGTTYFLHPPRLLGAVATQDGTNIWSASYYFTLVFPETADEPLRTIVIAQQGGLGRPIINANTVQVYEGTRTRQGKDVPIAASQFDSNAQTLTLTFDPPIQPGRILTIRLNPVRNPAIAGTYLYGVTTFPVGTQPFGHFIGVGQIRIYDSNQD